MQCVRPENEASQLDDVCELVLISSLMFIGLSPPKITKKKKKQMRYKNIWHLSKRDFKMEKLSTIIAEQPLRRSAAKHPISTFVVFVLMCRWAVFALWIPVGPQHLLSHVT